MVEEVYHYVEYHRKKKGIIFYEDGNMSTMPQEVS